MTGEEIWLLSSMFGCVLALFVVWVFDDDEGGF